MDVLYTCIKGVGVGVGGVTYLFSDFVNIEWQVSIRNKTRLR